MPNSIFESMLSRYEIRTKDDKTNALHEVMQQIALAGLYRGGFFNKAAFYGGTCLRIFHGLQRFSEDMDFSLLQPDENFRLENYFDAIIAEFKVLGREVNITKKDKKTLTNVKSAFLKDTTEVYNLQFTTEKSVKIKIEVDTLPPLGFETEHKLLMLPFSFMVRRYTLPDLYAGKMHALLFRNWKGRVKGRDWYDFEWYVRNNVPLNFKHLKQRTLQLNHISESDFTPENFKNLLKEHILKTDIKAVKNDVRPFIKNPAEMDIWNTEYFLQVVDFIRFSTRTSLKS
ncbi:MAG: nucleotidyl transferase AbiEii/AbiGii toxin family protein [Dysgonamonadaceae bacterium]|jgi:predicted nucleotidyltransferase component of viral defense system|nr:nucleotidyl transferase AbiEii/AbiGii toxin family protein [Dysgonamonadaceae bacterium]